MAHEAMHAKLSRPPCLDEAVANALNEQRDTIRVVNVDAEARALDSVGQKFGRWTGLQAHRTDKSTLVSGNSFLADLVVISTRSPSKL